MDSSIRLDDTILPGGALDEDIDWGVFLRPLSDTAAAMRAEIDHMFVPVILGYCLATESSPGELKEVAIRDKVDAAELAESVLRLPGS